MSDHDRAIVAAVEAFTANPAPGLGVPAMVEAAVDAYLEARRPTGDARIGAGEAVLLDELGAAAIETRPAGELAVILDVGGKLNRRHERVSARYLMRIGQAAELVADIVVAAYRGGPAAAAVFDREVDAAKDRLR